MRCLARPFVLGLASTVVLACTSGNEDDTFATTADATSGDGDGDSSETGGGNCGDGVVDDGEECDLGPDNSSSGQCTPDCTIAECGDGFVQTELEECDDGNQDDTDACVSGCRRWPTPPTSGAPSWPARGSLRSTASSNNDPRGPL